jgi:hypothetical protein
MTKRYRLPGKKSSRDGGFCRNTARTSSEVDLKTQKTGKIGKILCGVALDDGASDRFKPSQGGLVISFVNPARIECVDHNFGSACSEHRAVQEAS